MQRLEFDEHTVALLDTDGDGRVRAPELVVVVVWLKRVLRAPSGLAPGNDRVPRAALEDGNAEGRAPLQTARRMLAMLGQHDQTVLTVDDAVQATALWARAAPNGDGVVPPGALPDEETRQAALDGLRTAGGAADRSGEQGVDDARRRTFFGADFAHAAWLAAARDRAAVVLPLGPATATAVDTVAAIEAKLED
ncbi:MAG: hypothetical protein FJ137_03810 [Deltaproteobacteria bacterium]|nr:hypothetical protein [Deltaproteobacteria bacterium]